MGPEKSFVWTKDRDGKIVAYPKKSRLAAVRHFNKIDRQPSSAYEFPEYGWSTVATASTYAPEFKAYQRATAGL